ncbi:hypothetical protein PM082_020274 [Marasmius tenuissimus]|nr:hypothetical protein PM082_020274 [Marasmius tenuissimus]
MHVIDRYIVGGGDDGFELEDVVGDDRLEGVYGLSESEGGDVDENGYLCDGFVVSDNEVEWEEEVEVASDEEESSDSMGTASSFGDDGPEPEAFLGQCGRSSGSGDLESARKSSERSSSPSVGVVSSSKRKGVGQRWNCIYSDSESDHLERMGSFVGTSDSHESGTSQGAVDGEGMVGSTTRKRRRFVGFGEDGICREGRKSKRLRRLKDMESSRE